MASVPTVILRAPLAELCEGREHSCGGTTVVSALRELEHAHPRVAGWILDDRGAIRPHVNVFVNGASGSGETKVGKDDRVHVLPAITGG